MFFIYILKSLINGKYYIGSTDDPNRRLVEHNKGLSKYTKIYRPWELLYTEKFKSLSEARQREKQIKSWKKRAAIEKLINGAFV